MYETHVAMDKETKTKRLWYIRYTLPKNEEANRKWAVNKTLTIASETMQEAFAEAIKIEPEATFWQINHGGPFHAIV